ncbi:MAG: hypothetical protein H0T39_06885 [Actinobacteria bacterium]|nr:hypothetical protein [Actinomycetota bacterium]
MARLYLHCVLCSRKQAEGLLSGAAWEALALPAGVTVEHPAVHRSTVRACPGCVAQHHRNWHAAALATLGVAGVALL